MSRTLNPTVMAFVPRSIEAAAKAMRPDPLNYPLPLSTQSPWQIHQPLARHIMSPSTQAHRMERMEKVRIIEPRAAPSTGRGSNPQYPKAQGTKNQEPKADGEKVKIHKRQQRRGKHLLLDLSAKPQKASRLKKRASDLYRPLVVDGSAVNRREQAPQKCDLARKPQRGIEQARSLRSSCQAKKLEELERRKKKSEKSIGTRDAAGQNMLLEKKGYSKIEACRQKCMGGKTFESNHSAVLAMETIWCPRSWKDDQKDAKWPAPLNFAIDGIDRHKNGYGRFLPVPRSEEFQWRLATKEWVANPKGTKYPAWTGAGPVPYQERRFARVRSELDAIIGTGLCVDELLLFDMAEEIAWEDSVGVIGRELWDEIAGDKREGLKEMGKTEGGVCKKEED